MVLWRLVRRRWSAAALDGEGARIMGGRWSPPGQRVVYTSTSLALATLEAIVHAGPSLLPRDLVAVRIEAPEDLARTVVAAADLPGDWRRYPAPAVLRAVGARWLRADRTPLLVVPSAVVPVERNVLINPAHPASARIRVTSVEPYRFDPRLGSHR